MYLVCVKVREQFMGVGSSFLHVGPGHWAKLSPGSAWWFPDASTFPSHLYSKCVRVYYTCVDACHSSCSGLLLVWKTTDRKHICTYTIHLHTERVDSVGSWVMWLWRPRRPLHDLPSSARGLWVNPCSAWDAIVSQFRRQSGARRVYGFVFVFCVFWYSSALHQVGRCPSSSGPVSCRNILQARRGHIHSGYLGSPGDV